MLLGVTFYGKLKSATYIVIKHQRFNKKLNFLARDTSCIKLPKRRLVVKTHRISNSFSPRVRKEILKLKKYSHISHICLSSSWICIFLIHFMQLVSFYTPWKHQKTFGFLIFLGSIVGDQWHEMGLEAFDLVIDSDLWN